MDTDSLKRQARAHLERLRMAGVEWLPAPPPGRPPLAAAAAASLIAPVEPSTTPAELFSVAKQPAEAATVEVPLDNRRQALQVLAQEVAKCQRCPELVASRSQTVFGQGEAGVELCFVGEAPGADEDAQGLPFVGAAGQLLNRIIAACGLKREEVYICNILKCRPPGNRTPLPNEAANCRGFLERQLELVQPRFICALGSCAAQNLLNVSTSLGKLRGRFHDFKGIPVLVTYHPAYLLPHRNPDKKRDVWEDMKTLLAKMGRTIPSK